MNLLDEGFHLLNEFERGAHQLRALVAQHTFKEILMENLDNLIDKFHALKGERADLVIDRDAQKARADKAETDLKALQDQIAADEAKVKAALDDVSAEVEAEKPVSVAVSAPTTAPATTIPVTADQPVATGSTVSGPGIADGTTVTASDGSSVTLSQPTVADHSGDGSETLTVVAPAAIEIPAAI